MKFKKLLTYIFGILVALNFNISSSLAGEKHYLTILHTNDVHGRLKPVDYGKNKCVGGFASRAKLIQQFKSQNKNILILDAGDIAQGTLFFKFFNGVPDVKFMSEAGYDAAELGNHEFDKGLENLKKMIEAANFPFLCSNIRFLNNSDLQKQIKPYIIKDYNGFKAAIIGVIAQDLNTLVGNYNDFEALNPVESVKNIVKEVNSQVDLIIALSHMGFEEDIKLANAVPEINIIVGGHSHTFLKCPKRVLNGQTTTLIVQDGEFGVNIGKLDLLFENKNIEKYDYESILVNGKDEDKVFSEKIAKLSRKIDSVANQKIGQIKTPLDVRRKKIKNRLTNAGALIVKSMKEKYPEADVVFLNAGAIRANKYIKAGFITKSDVFELYPFEDTVVVAEIKGSELKSALETSSKSLPCSSGSFLQSLGLEYTVNTANSPQVLSKDELSILKEGQRVSDVKINKNPLLIDKYYKVLLNDYMFNGGNGYSHFKNAKNIKKTDVFIQDAIIDYIKKYSPVSVEVEDKINLY